LDRNAPGLRMMEGPPETIFLGKSCGVSSQAAPGWFGGVGGGGGYPVERISLVIAGVWEEGVSANNAAD